MEREGWRFVFGTLIVGPALAAPLVVLNAPTLLFKALGPLAVLVASVVVLAPVAYLYWTHRYRSALVPALPIGIGAGITFFLLFLTPVALMLAIASYNELAAANKQKVHLRA